MTGVVDIHGSPGDRETIGSASAIGHDRNGFALFRLAIRGVTLTGEWRLIGREFTRVK